MFFKKKQQPYTITIADKGHTQTFECATEKEKNQWLYEYLSNNERMWAWVQWQSSPHKTFDKWFKEYVTTQWKDSNWQTFRINKKLILIKKI